MPALHGEAQAPHARSGRRAFSLGRTGWIPEGIDNAPKVFRVKLLIFGQQSHATVSEYKVGSAPVPRMLDLLEIVAAIALIDIHVDVRRTGSFFAEGDGFRRPGDLRLFHAMRP